MILEALFSPPDLPLWLLRLVFSVTLVCMAAALANLLLRRFSAAMRHRVWALAVAASLAMPAMIWWSPEVRLGWLNVAEPRATVAAEPPQATPRLPSAPTRRFARQLPAEPALPVSTTSPKTVSTDHQPIAKIAPSPIPAEAELQAQSAASAPQPRLATANAASTFPIFRMLDRNTFWILMLIVPAVCGAWQSLRCARGARRLVEEAQLIQDPATLELVEDVCRRLGWNHAIELRQTKRMPIPLCVGWWKPCVLLPPGWRSWGDMTLRAVLAHEVSHVVRRDVAWQFVARTACFLYWFHPLVWLAARKMRIERESACDDSVLGMVDQPVDYASVLLRFAREMVARTKPAAAALPMAGLSGLEGRVQAILDKGRRRSPVGARVSRVFTGAALLIAAGAAALSPLSWEVTEAFADTNGQNSLDFFQADGSAMKTHLMKRGLFGEISGRVVLKSQPGHGASRARILGIPENPKAAYVTAVADAQGYFHVPRLRSAMLFLAQNDERTLAGISRFDGQEAGVSISVGNPVSAHGRLVDATGKPLASWPIEYLLVLDGAYLDEYHVFQTRDAKRLLGGSATTGPNGEFTLTGLAPGWSYRISCCPGTVVNGMIQPFITISTFTPNQSGVTNLGTIERPRTETMDDVFLSESSTPQQIETLLTSARHSANMLDLRVLVISGAHDNEIIQAIRSSMAVSAPVNWKPTEKPDAAPQWAKDLAVQRPLLNYAVMGVDVTGPNTPTGKFLESHQLSRPASDDMQLAVLDPDGHLVAETSGRQLFAGKQPTAATLGDWLRKQKPKLPDAEKLLAQALAQAKLENKRVFLRENSPGAATYCTRLNLYVEKYKNLIEKDYVCLKIDVRCPNAIAVIDRIRDYDIKDYSSSSGAATLPWMVILDAFGRPVVSGTSPHGNIGIPESAQETSYYAWMLRASAQRLTDEEISKLVAGLSEGRP